MIKCTFIIACCVYLFAFATSDNAPILLDGQINAAEWAGAKEYPLTNGGQLFMIRKADDLYLGIKGYAQGWAHVYVSRQDTIRVLHASAALGDQLYTKINDKWKLQSRFNWQLRDDVYNNDLAQQQSRYYHQYGWCANNNNTGDKNTLEFRINLHSYDTASLKIAVVFTADAKLYCFYPAGLTDDTLLQNLVVGNPADSLRFNISEWMKMQ